MTSATSLELIRLTHTITLECSLRRRSSSSPLREAFRCSDCMRPAVGVLMFLPRFSFIFHSCIRREPCTFLPARRAPLRPQRMMGQRPMLLSSMLRSLKHQAQLRRPQSTSYEDILRRGCSGSRDIDLHRALLCRGSMRGYKAVVGGMLLAGITCPLLLPFL
jgi:hypothetical protein